MTLSVTARCSRTGQLGVALSSFDVLLTFLPVFDGHESPRFFSLVVPDLGAVTGQANTLPTFQAAVIGHLRSGLNAQTALDQALSEEAEAVRDGFQVAVVDAAGDTAAFTGGRPDDWRGHRVGAGWVAAGNILSGESVVNAVAEALERSEESALDERLLIALEAGIAAGGDRRGHRCGYLRVASPDGAVNFEIRVHEHARPLEELRRLRDVYHVEGDFVTLALSASRAIREVVTDDELDALGTKTVIDAVIALRSSLAKRGAAAESLTAIDRLLSALAARPEESQMIFGPIIRMLASVS